MQDNTDNQPTVFQPDLSELCIESLWLKNEPRDRTIMIVFAHPDDESFGNGGTILRYSHDGVAVHYVCATRGECGSIDPQLLKRYDDIAALRTAELTCAAHTLGLTAVHFLGYRDSGMAGTTDNLHPNALVQVPLAQVARQVAALIHVLRPHIVITFGPYGGYGHPDHIKVHQATLAAMDIGTSAYPQQHTPDRAAWTPNKLYFSTFDTRLLRWGVRLMRLLRQDPRRSGQNGDVDLVRALNEATPITTSIDSSRYLAQKERAWLCHHSQIGGMGAVNRLPGPLRRAFLGSEHFTRIIPPPLQARRRERDLFEGIDVQPNRPVT